MGGNAKLERAKVLVTGSHGFIGRWTCQAIDRAGGECVQVDRVAEPGQRCYRADILDANEMRRIFREERPKYVVHLAARCDLEGKTLADYSDNIEGVRLLCELVREAGCVKRAIYTSSQLVCRIGLIPNEPDEYCPNTVYGESKVWTEKIVREMGGGGCEWCIVRPTTAWGPGMGPHYQQLFRLLERRWYFHPGAGELYKSYGYVKNMAYQYLQLLCGDTEQVDQKMFYLADYDPLSLRKYIDSLAFALGTQPPITIPLFLAKILAIGGDVVNWGGIRFPYNSFRLRNIRTEYVYDLSATRAICGDLPSALDDAVKETVDWYKEIRFAHR